MSTTSDIEAIVHGLMLKHYDGLRKWLRENGLRAPDPFILAKLVADLIRSDLEGDDQLFDRTVERIADELGLRGKPMRLAHQALYHLMRIAALAYIKATTSASLRRRA